MEKQVNPDQPDLGLAPPTEFRSASPTDLGRDALEDTMHGDEDGYVGPNGQMQPHQTPAEVAEQYDEGLDANEQRDRELLDEI